MCFCSACHFYLEQVGYHGGMHERVLRLHVMRGSVVCMRCSEK